MRAEVRAILQERMGNRLPERPRQTAARKPRTRERRSARPLVREGAARAISDQQCSRCHGTGAHDRATCPCVYRAVFRAVMLRYEKEQAACSSVTGVTFCADVELTAAQALDNGTGLEIFRRHVIEGRTWRECSRALGLDRGNFFHAVYRMQETIGRYWFELQGPDVTIYPTSRYFARPAGPHRWTYFMRSDVRWKAPAARAL